GAQQRPAGEIEAPATLSLGELDGGVTPSVRRQGGEVDERQRGSRRRRQDGLQRLAPRSGEDGAQGLVPAHDLGEGPTERHRVEWTAQLQGRWNVEDRGAGLEAVHVPEPLLREGELRGAGTRPRHDSG